MSKGLFSLEEWTLCLVTMLWGGTFLIIRFAMQACGPFYFVGLRFACAGLVLLFLSLPLLKKISMQEMVGGVVIGVTIFLGFGLQTLGLVDIPAAKSAFITAFYVPLVPIFELLILHRRPDRYVWLGMAFAFPGVLMVAWPEQMALGFGRGEFVTMICAVVFALEIVLLAIFAPNCNTRRMVTVEALVCSFLSFACMPLVGESVRPLPLWLVACLLGLGLVTAFIQSLLTWAQKSVPPSRATLIYAGEPVWAGLFGSLAGERLGSLALLGCVLVITGTLVSSRKQKR
ncbi:MAG: DMT family transporter [Desulfovibrio sp.]|nr:DMT family transporter [Desulfovibrio sp.]